MTPSPHVISHIETHVFPLPPFRRCLIPGGIHSSLRRFSVRSSSLRHCKVFLEGSNKRFLVRHFLNQNPYLLRIFLTIVTTMAKSQYHYGKRKEEQVARQLRKKGYRIITMKGSRGASDLEAKKGSKKWVVQVKATRKEETTRISPKGRRRLKIQARKKGVHQFLLRFQEDSFGLDR